MQKLNSKMFSQKSETGSRNKRTPGLWLQFKCLPGLAFAFM